MLSTHIDVIFNATLKNVKINRKQTENNCRKSENHSTPIFSLFLYFFRTADVFDIWPNSRNAHKTNVHCPIVHCRRVAEEIGERYYTHLSFINFIII